MANSVAVGDKVLVPEYGGTKVVFEEQVSGNKKWGFFLLFWSDDLVLSQDYFIFRDGDILGVYDSPKSWNYERSIYHNWSCAHRNQCSVFSCCILLFICEYWLTLHDIEIMRKHLATPTSGCKRWRSKVVRRARDFLVEQETCVECVLSALYYVSDVWGTFLKAICLSWVVVVVCSEGLSSHG